MERDVVLEITQSHILATFTFHLILITNPQRVELALPLLHPPTPISTSPLNLHPKIDQQHPPNPFKYHLPYPELNRVFTNFVIDFGDD